MRINPINISRIENKHVSFKGPYIDDLAYAMDDRIYDRDDDDYSSTSIERSWNKGLLRIHKRNEAEMRDLAESFHDYSDEDLLDVCKEAYWTSWGAIDNYRKLKQAVHEVQEHKKAVMQEIAPLTKRTPKGEINISSPRTNLTSDEQEKFAQLKTELDRLQDKIYTRDKYKK